MSTRLTDIAVIVPVYRELSDDDERIFSNINSKLGRFRRIIIAPENMRAGNRIEMLTGYSKWEVWNFDTSFFNGSAGYNKLFLTNEFYRRFLKEKINYILVHQLDAFVFYDQLSYWCRQGFDYIGAPWDSDENLKKVLQSSKRRYIKMALFVNRYFFNKKDWRVGNGGFSIRNVRKSYFMVRWFGRWLGKLELNEDVIWSIVVPLIFPFFRVPNDKQVLSFAFELAPRQRFVQNNHQLPMGCHAWAKYDPEFWKEHISYLHY